MRRTNGLGAGYQMIQEEAEEIPKEVDHELADTKKDSVTMRGDKLSTANLSK